MDDRQRQSLGRKFAGLLDEDASDAELDHDDTAESSVTEVRRRLQAEYLRHPGVTTIALRIDDTVVGVTSRARVMRESGTAGPSEAGVGDADRATQPGDSSQYRVLLFHCRRCKKDFRTMYYDEREIPVCGDHGPAVLLP